MLKFKYLSDSDILILAVAVVTVASILGLLSDVIMRQRSFGALRNTLIILAGGIAGETLRAFYYPVPMSRMLIPSLMAAVAGATVALVAARLCRKLLLG